MSMGEVVFWWMFISFMTLCVAAIFLVLIPIHREQKRMAAEARQLWPAQETIDG